MPEATAARARGPALSVILPCYRAAALARRSVATLSRFLSTTPLTWEIIVVDDGGGDLVDAEWRGIPSVRVIRLPVNRGKGAAVAAGMLAARGDARVFTDIDLPFDLDLLPVMTSYIRERGFHVVVGDRTLPGSRYRSELAWRRRAASALFSSVVAVLVTGRFFHDTQCGLKGVRGDIADHLFRLLRIDRFTFDVELVHIALRHHLDIKRIPVQLRNDEASTVHVIRDSARMIGDLLRIRWHSLLGGYRSAAIVQAVHDDFERLRIDAASGGGRLTPPLVADAFAPRRKVDRPARTGGIEIHHPPADVRYPEA
jgi:dolichyl-phosphate beta-glucosyltransferase